MYSPKIISQKLSTIQSKIDYRPKPLQFTLRPYTVAESRFYTNHLYGLVEGKYVPGKPKTWQFNRPLLQDELNFIENERILCQNSFLYCATHYYFVKLSHTSENLSLFSPWVSQKIILDMWSEAEEAFFAIMMIYLKARQLGVSTVNELAIAHRIHFYTEKNALVASSDPDKTKKMAGMMKRCWDNTPPWLIGEYTITESKELWANFPENKSSVTCQHGTGLSGIARGDSPDLVHVSELPDFNNPTADVDEALINTIHENPTTFFVLESTAKGKTGKGEWWYEKWKWAKENYPKNKTRFRPVFLPWFIGTDIYPTTTWAHQFLPKPLSGPKAKWQPSKVTALHALKCKEYVEESPQLQKYLGEGWSLPLRQQYFWEFIRAEYEEKDQLFSFYTELCASDQEAFQRSGKGVISIEQAEYLRNTAKKLALFHGKPAVFAIIGEGVQPEHEPDLDEIDTSRPYIKILSDWDQSSDPKVYYLIPLHHHPNVWDKRLFIWEFPFPKVKIDGKMGEVEQEYSTGVDGSEGLEGRGDNSSIQVVKKGSLLWQAEQVAEFVCSSMMTIELLPYTLAIGSFFSKRSKEYVNQCRQTIEINFGGSGLQHNIRLAGWSNFHRWEGAYDNLKRRSAHKMGWETNAWSRPLLMGPVIRAIKGGFFKLNSPYLIEELTNLQRDLHDNQRIEAKGSDHDDRFFSAAPAFFSLHAWELYMMSKGDKSITQMFKGYKEEAVPGEGELTLAEAIAATEKNSNYEGKVSHYVYNNVLPTLD